MFRRIVFFLLVLSVLAVGLVTHLYSQWHKPLDFDNPVQIAVERGMSVPHVLLQLHEQNVPVGELYFRSYFRLTGSAPRIRQGIFRLEPGMSISELEHMLTSTPGMMVAVTIPEGRASWEIFALFQEQFPHLDSNAWDSLVHDTGWTRELGLHAPSLEGYLFPDTYKFTHNAAEKEILQTMVDRFLDVWSELSKKDSSRVLAKVGQNGVVTLASIVEEETSLGKERRQIAGVFWQRYLKGWPLGADPTVRFVFRNLTGPIYRSQLRHDSPYNTRLNAGLPPGAISNPGKRALQAALFPATTPYLYFVAKDDGSRAHWFSTNLNDHNKYKDQAARNRAAAGISD